MKSLRASEVVEPSGEAKFDARKTGLFSTAGELVLYTSKQGSIP